ncbi:hypothetical protein FC756_07610 [Lysinibacillus mangiferihumi]|uniref:Uncharacterized protein n=1 Tax=Lysinibacillus mangiferihumi TaxID=1130819 RepID=A0A4U2Z8A0_9BACI|nr:hypothetical protein [Lysinibacillus mangiferihumi]TKI70508.1 hypothetical protein FC756_07610 [Lysinibacillus mangiferihumi]
MESFKLSAFFWRFVAIGLIFVAITSYFVTIELIFVAITSYFVAIELIFVAIPKLTLLYIF